MQLPEALTYRGFEIRPRSLQRRDSGRWSIQTHIRRNAVVRPYFASNTFATEEQAVLHCFEFGRQIIDGDIPGLELP